MQISLIGWLHTAACCYALLSGGLMLWRAKGGLVHRRAGQRYLLAMLVANLSAFALHRLGSFNIFHILALATLASLLLAYACARWRKPGRYWLRLHLSAIIFSYYQLVGGLINELFVQVPALHAMAPAPGLLHGAAMVFFLMMLAYFWGATAKRTLLAGALTAALAGTTQASTLTLELSGLDAGKGQVILALYDKSEQFLKKATYHLTVPADGSAMKVMWPDLPPGDYALALYQDVNNNGKLDRTMFGIPSEPAGFANNARGSFGPPAWEAARFSLPGEGKTLAIRLQR